MNGTLIGYARCSTDEQDLTAQRQILAGLGVAEDRTYLDHGLTGTNRNRPGLDQALAAVRSGDTLVVPKLDRLARSVPDARDIGDSLTARGIRLSLGGTIYDQFGKNAVLPELRDAQAEQVDHRAVAGTGDDVRHPRLTDLGLGERLVTPVGRLAPLFEPEADGEDDDVELLG